jgi:hypothetical protein
VTAARNIIYKIRLTDSIRIYYCNNFVCIACLLNTSTLLLWQTMENAVLIASSKHRRVLSVQMSPKGFHSGYFGGFSVPRSVGIKLFMAL